MYLYISVWNLHKLTFENKGYNYTYKYMSYYTIYLYNSCRMGESPRGDSEAHSPIYICVINIKVLFVCMYVCMHLYIFDTLRYKYEYYT